jgi:hypothetical protein
MVGSKGARRARSSGRATHGGRCDRQSPAQFHDPRPCRPCCRGARSRRGAPAAQDATPAPRLDPLARLIKLVDKDGDGFISAAEAQSFAGAHFDKLDVEHNGYLTFEEFEAPLRRAIDRASKARRPRLEKTLPRAEAAFKAINKAGDGRLAWAELLADSGARFIAADTDKDGKLSLDALVVATVPPSKRRAPPPAASARINEMIAGSCAALTRSISAASSFFTLPIA